MAQQSLRTGTNPV